MAFYKIETTMEHVSHIGFENDKGYVIINNRYIVPILRKGHDASAFTVTTPLFEWDYYTEGRYRTTFSLNAAGLIGDFRFFSSDRRWWTDASGLDHKGILPYGFTERQVFDEYINEDGLKTSYSSPGRYITLDGDPYYNVFHEPYDDLVYRESITTEFPGGIQGKIVKRLANEVWMRSDDGYFYRMKDFDTVDKQDFKVVGLSSLWFYYKNKLYSLSADGIRNGQPYNETMAKKQIIMFSDDTFTFFVNDSKKATLTCIKEGKIKTWKGEIPEKKLLDSFSLELINEDGVEDTTEQKTITAIFRYSLETSTGIAPQRVLIAPYLGQTINR